MKITREQIISFCVFFFTRIEFEFNKVQLHEIILKDRFQT